MKQRPKYRGSQVQNDVEKDKTSDEEIEMASKSSSSVTLTRLTEIQLQEGDTLQALSIRYHCPIAELKRLNNLHKENEIFARRTIKVPYRHFSMPAIHKSGENSPEANIPKRSIDASILKQKLASVSSTDSLKNGSIVHDLIDLGSSSQIENNFNQIIFNTTIIQKEERTEIEDFTDEEIQLLPNNQISQDVPTPFSCSGADWGLSWPILLGLILIVAFFGPLLYILYITEHPEKYHPHS